jgi:hypothetical protein
LERTWKIRKKTPEYRENWQINKLMKSGFGSRVVARAVVVSRRKAGTQQQESVEMLYKRGGVWWYKFQFQGQVIRTSAKTSNKTVAREAERASRREFELGLNRIRPRQRMPLFSVAADEWLASRVGLAPGTLDRYRHQIALLKKEFGGRLISDITSEDVAALQKKRESEGRSGRTVNYEIGTLGHIMKRPGLWASIRERIKNLRERHDIGRALSGEDERKLLEAVGRSDSPSLLPLFVLTLDTGLRAAEARSLRHKDLELQWKDGAIVSGRLIVPKSKTEAGRGRAIPFTGRVCSALTLWLSHASLEPTPIAMFSPITASPAAVASPSITSMTQT